VTAQESNAIDPELPELPPGEVTRWCGEQVGAPFTSAHALPGGAGTRRYWRLEFRDGRTAVLSRAVPERPEILPPGLRVPQDPNELPFVAVSRVFERARLPVPSIIASRADGPWLLLEDLGDRRLCDLDITERRPLELAAMELLARLHAIDCSPDELPAQRHFDREWIGFELGLLGEQAPPALREPLGRELDQLAHTIAALPRVVSHRDFQSQNLMIDPGGELRLIDFQDALLAPRELDLAAFLFDSYLERSDRERDELAAAYWTHAGGTADPEALALLVTQRKAKDLSRFTSLLGRGDTRYADAERSARAALLVAASGLPDALGELADLLHDWLGGAQ
jgi:aminoglycoside/choline kinase family phosphotransferase